MELIKDFTLEETLKAKRVYEKILSLARHAVKSYWADNGWFVDKDFYNICTERDQMLTFCRVGVHYQNSIVENRNKRLTLGAHTLLLDGMWKWPQILDTIFWLYALKAQAERMNCLHLDVNDQTPESKLHDLLQLDNISVKNFHHYFVQSTSWITAYKTQAEPAHWNENHSPELALTFALNSCR